MVSVHDMQRERGRSQLTRRTQGEQQGDLVIGGAVASKCVMCDVVAVEALSLCRFTFSMLMSLTRMHCRKCPYLSVPYTASGQAWWKAASPSKCLPKKLHIV